MLLESKNNKDSKAVSPVIGVILMVAITVILAAVIGTAVLGLGEGVNEEATAGATVEFDQTENTFAVNWVSAGNAEHVRILLSGDFGYDEGGTDGPVVMREPGTTATFGQGTSGGDSMEVNGDVQQYESGSLQSIESVMLSDDIADGDEIRVTVVASTTEYGTEGGTNTTITTKEGEF